MPKRGGCPVGKIRRKAYTRKGYTKKDGTRVKAARVRSGCIPDKGAPGKGPKTLPKPKKGSLEGWSKDLPQKKRMAILKKITKEESCGTAIRKLNLLRNITTDKPTKKAAKSDMAKLRKQTYCKLKTK